MSDGGNRPMTFGSLFAGIGGFDAGLIRAGLTPTWAVERDQQCNSVRRRHWPDEEQHTDVTTFTVRSTRHRPDLICGGFPCQDLSVAGSRAGLAGERSGLWREFRRIIADFTPGIVLIENVPGLLSSNNGRDMGTILGALGQLGYRWSYRILDSQYFGVAQRRQRVFSVGSLGGWPHPAEILFDSESVSGNSAPSREASADVATCVRGGTEVSSNERVNDVASVTHTLLGEGFDGGEDGTGRGTPIVPVAFSSKDCGQDAGEVAPTMRSMNFDKSHMNGGGQLAVAYSLQAGTVNARTTQQAVAYQCHGSDIGKMGTLMTDSGHIPFVEHEMVVRRLTPRECERLQSFPDDWSRYGHDGKEISDSARYGMLGNAVTVNVAHWLGSRITGAMPCAPMQG